MRDQCENQFSIQSHTDTCIDAWHLIWTNRLYDLDEKKKTEQAK